MQAKEQLLEVQSVLDRLTRFRHINGWAAVAAGLLSIGAWLLINYIYTIPLFDNNIAPDLVIPKTHLAEYISVILIFLIISTVICGSIILFSLPRDLTRHGWRNLIRLIAVFGLYIIGGAAIAYGIVFNVSELRISSVQLIPPLMCVIYALAQFHAVHISIPALRFLGFWLLLAGVAGFFFPAYCWFLWMLGFGFGHLITGFIVIFRNRN